MAFGEGVVRGMIQVLTIVIFILVVMPNFLAPAWGITPVEYESNKILWSVLAGMIGGVVGWVLSKPINSSIRRGGL